MNNFMAGWIDQIVAVLRDFILSHPLILIGVGVWLLIVTAITGALIMTSEWRARRRAERSARGWRTVIQGYKLNDFK